MITELTHQKKCKRYADLVYTNTGEDNG